MVKKVFNFFLLCVINFAFAQNSSLNVAIQGMHCAGGCAKMIENSLNKNDGISAVVDFSNSSATIIYDSQLFSDTEIVEMINGYRGGKFTASLPANQSVTCTKGKSCCKKTGKKNAQCDNKNSGCCSSSNTSKSTKKKKNKTIGSLSGGIPGHTGCTKSCCSGK